MSDEKTTEENRHIIAAENLVKIYKTAVKTSGKASAKVFESEVMALQGLDLQIEYGEFVAIIGNSGSGKSTLLNIIGGLDKPSAGSLFVDGIDMNKLSKNDLLNYKKNTIGFIWQNKARNLIDYLTAAENICIPMILNGKADFSRARELLDLVGLKSKEKKKVYELSGGEQQRVAIAIAIANKPKLLLADEPTGALDSKTADQFFDVMNRLNKELNLSIVAVTHDTTLSKKVNRTIAIRDGKTSSEILRTISYEDEMLNAETTGETNKHIEYAVIDRAGRVQIPRNYLDEIGMQGKNKLLVSLNDGKIVLENK